MFDLLAYRRPFIRMFLKSKWTKQKPYVAIRLVQVALLEFLDHDIALNFQTFISEGETEHPVAFEPERGLNVLGRNGTIIIGDVVCCESVVLSSYKLQWFVITWDVHATSEHKMLKQMRKAGFALIFISGA